MAATLFFGESTASGGRAALPGVMGVGTRGEAVDGEGGALAAGGWLLAAAGMAAKETEAVRVAATAAAAAS